MPSYTFLDTPVVYPAPISYPILGGPAVAHTMDADGEKQAAVFHIKKDGVIDKFGFLLWTVAQAPANGLRVSIQELDASGLPDGVNSDYFDIVTSGIVTNTWVLSDKLTDDGTDTGAQLTVAPGDLIALVIEYESFTVGDDIDIGHVGWTGLGRDTWEIDYSYVAAWAISARRWNATLQYDDGTFVYSTHRHFHDGVVTTYNVGNASTPDEHAVVITIPFGVRAIGVSQYLRALGPYEAVLTDYTTDAVIFALTCKSDNDASGSPNSNYLATPVDVPAGKYRLSVRPSSATTSQFYTATMDTDASVQALSGLQNSGYYSSRVDGGAWTDDTGETTYGSLIIDAVENPGNKDQWGW